MSLVQTQKKKSALLLDVSVKKFSALLTENVTEVDAVVFLLTHCTQQITNMNDNYSHLLSSFCSNSSKISSSGLLSSASLAEFQSPPSRITLQNTAGRHTREGMRIRSKYV